MDGRPCFAARLGLLRQDIQRKQNRADCLHSGWEATVPLEEIPTGKHQISALAWNRAGGCGLLVGTRTIDVTNQTIRYEEPRGIDNSIPLISPPLEESTLPPWVDIIVPIHNEWPHLLQCLKSIARTCRPRDRVILIEDASTEPRLLKYLSSLRSGQTFRVLSHNSPLGPVASLNRAFQIVSSDAILLHPYAVVAEGWIEQLLACADSARNVATVSPWTNVGSTPFTIAVFNPLRIEEAAATVRDVSQRQYPKIPASGPIALVRRKALEEVGYLDEATYSDRDDALLDFCLRAEQCGFIHLLDDATFIPAVAPIPEKPPHSSILDARYPSVSASLSQFDRQDPLGELRQQIHDELRAPKTKSSRLLFILQGPIHHFAPPGGVEWHCRDLIQGLRNHEIWTLHSTANTIRIQDLSNIQEYEFPLRHSLVPWDDDLPSVRSTWGDILKRFEFDLVHIHHLLGHSLNVPQIAKESGLPVVLSVHDYYLFCPNHNLVDPSHQFCGFCRDERQCDPCLDEILGLPRGTATQWRTYVMENVLPCVDRFVFPSKDACRSFCHSFPIDIERAQVIPHGMARQSPPFRRDPRKEALQLAFMDSLTVAKGSRWVEQIVRSSYSSNVEIHFLGPDPSQKYYFPDAHPTWRGKIHFHGPYMRDELPIFLATEAIDLALIPSVWPETYSLILDEVWSAGIPVIGSSLGAIGERIRTHGGGYTIEPYDTEGLIRLLDRLLDHPGEIEERRREISRMRFPTLEEIAGHYETLYGQLLGRPKKNSERVR